MALAGGHLDERKAASPKKIYRALAKQISGDQEQLWLVRARGSRLRLGDHSHQPAF
jgi:hypothetical protein